MKKLMMLITLLGSSTQLISMNEEEVKSFYKEIKNQASELEALAIKMKIDNPEEFKPFIKEILLNMHDLTVCYPKAVYYILKSF